MDRKLVLVIDDDRAVRDAFELALIRDFEVAVAEGGVEGIAEAKRRRPDLIFLDLKMPGMDGVDTMRALLSHDPTLSIYIVTAFAIEYMGRLAEAKREGMSFQIASKPLAREQIRLIAANAA